MSLTSKEYIHFHHHDGTWHLTQPRDSYPAGRVYPSTSGPLNLSSAMQFESNTDPSANHLTAAAQGFTHALIPGHSADNSRPCRDCTAPRLTSHLTTFLSSDTTHLSISLASPRCLSARYRLSHALRSPIARFPRSGDLSLPVCLDLHLPHPTTSHHHSPDSIIPTSLSCADCSL